MALSEADITRCTEILRRYGATRILIFGSALDSLGEARDLDLAVDGIEGWDFFRAAAEVERDLPVPLDLIPLSPPSPFTLYIEKKGRWIDDHL